MAEHAVFHNLFDYVETMLEQVHSLAEIKSLATLVDKMMSPHSKTEDDLLIEPLEHYIEQIGQSETFHDEHTLIEETLAKVNKAKSVGGGKRLLLSAITMSRKHFDKEERIVFPLAERVLKANTLTALGTEWMKRRDAALK